MLFASVDERIRRQLDAVWHTVTPKTKQARACTPACMHALSCGCGL